MTQSTWLSWYRTKQLWFPALHPLVRTHPTLHTHITTPPVWLEKKKKKLTGLHLLIAEVPKRPTKVVLS